MQKSVYYCPDYDFYPFDIKCIYTEEREEYLDYIDFELIIENCKGWKVYAKKIFEGSLEECLQYDSKFESIVAKQHGMKSLSKHISFIVKQRNKFNTQYGTNSTPILEDDVLKNVSNVCEGIVIKPLLQNHKFGKNNDRLIFKKKNDEFMELKSVKKVKKKLGLSKYEQDILINMEKYVTKNRFECVMSKEGEYTKKNISKYIRLFREDIYKDFEKDNPGWKFELNDDVKKIETNINKSLVHIILRY